jgi:thiaminase/transcriptional activator TenA
MKLSQQLYESAKEIWDSYYTHPFVAEMAQGTLAKDKFRYYMIQDYLYLLKYAKVFALGVAKSDDEELMRKFSQSVHSILNGEMSIHKNYMKRLGITPEEVKQAKMSLANDSYTAYMLQVAYEKGPLAILVAILSCAWSYQCIGAHNAKVPGALEHPFYGEWVQGYTSKEYVEETEDLIAWVDKLGENISQEEREGLKRIFVQCSRYEYEFWDMAYQKEM